MFNGRYKDRQKVPSIQASCTQKIGVKVQSVKKWCIVFEYWNKFKIIAFE